MVYKWKTGFIKTPANIAGEVMEELSKEGRLTPRGLVDASRPDDAPLHNEFEWNDETAAELYRQEQAKFLIREIVVVNDESPKKETTRAFVSITQNDERSYEPISVVLNDEDKTKILFETALRELKSFEAKYSGIKAFAALFAEIDKLAKE